VTRVKRSPCAIGVGIFIRPVLSIAEGSAVEGVESMPTHQKIDLVEELKDKFSRCTIAVATDYTGLPGTTMTELRQRMREKEIEYMVVKNTLAYLAADSAQRPQIKEIVQGPTALAFGYQDPVEVAKALEEYIRVNRSTLAIRGAVLTNITNGGRTLAPEEVLSLTRLPPRSELVAQLLGQLQLPMATLIGQLQAPISRLLAVMNRPLVSLTILLQRRAEQLTAISSQPSAASDRPSEG